MFNTFEQGNILHNKHEKHSKFNIHITGQMDLRKGWQLSMHPNGSRIFLHNSAHVVPLKKKAQYISFTFREKQVCPRILKYAISLPMCIDMGKRNVNDYAIYTTKHRVNEKVSWGEMQAAKEIRRNWNL